ncbi:MAG: hypothetical protein ACRC92_17030 [Peptostreptococcaceae bacterium]
MKDKNIKKVFDQIQADESMKARMLENIYKQSEKELDNSSDNNKVVQFKYKKSIAILAASVVLVCGALINNNDLLLNKNIQSGPGSSQVIGEELAVKGKIDKIEVSEEGAIITVGGVKISVNANTNIFKGDSLLEVTDLEEGQNVEVYSDGVQNDVLNGLRVEVLK